MAAVRYIYLFTFLVGCRNIHAEILSFQVEAEDYDYDNNLSSESRRLYITSDFKMTYNAADLFCREKNMELLSSKRENWNPRMLSNLETFVDPQTDYWLKYERQTIRGRMRNVQKCYKMTVDSIRMISVQFDPACSRFHRFAICEKPWRKISDRIRSLADKIDALEFSINSIGF